MLAHAPRGIVTSLKLSCSNLCLLDFSTPDIGASALNATAKESASTISIG